MRQHSPREPYPEHIQYCQPIMRSLLGVLGALTLSILLRAGIVPESVLWVELNQRQPYKRQGM